MNTRGLARMYGNYGCCNDTGINNLQAPRRHSIRIAERSTEGVGESSTNSKPNPAVVIYVGKLPKSQKPPQKVGMPRKKLASQEARPRPSTSDSAGTGIHVLVQLYH